MAALSVSLKAVTMVALLEHQRVDLKVYQMADGRVVPLALRKVDSMVDLTVVVLVAWLVYQWVDSSVDLWECLKAVQ